MQMTSTVGSFQLQSFQARHPHGSVWTSHSTGPPHSWSPQLVPTAGPGWEGLGDLLHGGCTLLDS